MEEKTNNVVLKIKSLLLNFDMTIAYVKSEIEIRESAIEILSKENEEGKSKIKKKKIIENKADIEMYSTFLNDLIRKRENLIDNLNVIFKRFNHPEIISKVFFDYFIKERTIQDIQQDIEFLNEEEIQKIIDKLNEQIITYYE